MDEQNNLAGGNVPGQPTPPVQPPTPDLQPQPPAPQPPAQPMEASPGMIVPPAVNAQARQSSWAGITPTMPQNQPPAQPAPVPPPQPQFIPQPSPPVPMPNLNMGSKPKLPKKLVVIGLGLLGLTVFAGLIIAALSFFKGNSITLEEYKSEKVGFSVQRPKGWDVSELTLSVKFTETKETAVQFEKIKAAASMDVERTYTGDLSKEEIFSTYDDEISGTDNKINVVNTTNVKIDGYDAKVYDLTGTNDVFGEDVPMVGKFVLIVTDKKYMYTMVLESPQKRKAFIDVFDKIIGSLKLTPPSS